jgi:hypothetical protein
VSQAGIRQEEVIQVYGCRCGCGWGGGFARWPAREDRIRWLEEYQRDLQQQAAEVADEIKNLKEQQQPAT